ncbi:MAG: S8 family serine peptidase, partial [Clostridia bacterium]|nr:S8 family serine peptidase [Clostridia bacterium]
IKCALKDAIKLERMQEVEYVSAQSKVFALENENASLDNRNIANSLSLPTDLDGEGVTMCVMDTGVSVHSDLSIPRERIVHFVDMIDGDNEAYDDNGHGTFVAGVAAGNGTLSGGKIRGVAPRANIVGIKVIGANGESGTFKILDGMQWLFDNFRQYGIRVVCMSFGAEPQSYADPLKMGVEMLARSGLTVVVASGNSGENALKSPAISNEVIAVGAVDNENKLAPFTSRGIYQGAIRPDVFSDGVNVKGISAGGTYSTMTGTSAAAPYVAGACCLLCQKYRNITPRQIKHAIINSAMDIDGNKIFRL